MNLHIPSPRRISTQAAEGLFRRGFTMDEIERMLQAGILAEGERFELIGGEIVPMSPKGVPHETVKKDLNRFWARALPDDIDILQETTLRISAIDFREPDFVFWPRAAGVAGLTPETVMLLVEVSDSSLDYDLGRKAAYYAGIGIPEYWVINARTLVTRVHQLPRSEAYTSISELAHTALITPARLPALAVRLADLGLEPTTE